MSEENVELSLRGDRRIQPARPRALLALADPDIEWIPAHRGARRAAALSRPRRYPTLVGGVARRRPRLQRRGRGRTSPRRRNRGAGASSRPWRRERRDHGADVWQFAEWRQRKCVRYRTFESEAEALEAAGLSE